VLGIGGGPPAQSETAWTQEFGESKSDLLPTGHNPFFIVEPGYQLTLEDGKDRLVITVLRETKMVDGVQTAIIEEREWGNSALVEVSRNYFAVSKRTNSVYYFGEDVDIYKNDKVVGHEGAWLSGVNGARYGLMMPGVPLVKGRYYQEIAPKVAMDRAEIVAMGETFTTPAGVFKNTLRTAETTPIEPGPAEGKTYASGVGLLHEGSLKLVKYGQAGPP
jgi:hypothetical protein